MVNVNKSLSKTPGTGASKTTPAATKRRPRNQALNSSKLNSNRTFIRKSQLNSALGEDSEAKRTLQSWLDQKSDEYGSDLTISDWSIAPDKGSSEPKLDIKVVETNGDIIAEGTENRSKFIKEFYDFMEEQLLPHIATNQPEIKFVSASWPGSYDEWAASDFSRDNLDSSLNGSNAHDSAVASILTGILNSSKSEKLNSSANGSDAESAREYLIQQAISDGSSREEAVEELDDFERQIDAHVVGLPTEEEKADYGDGFWVENNTGGHRYYAIGSDGYYHEVDLDSSKKQLNSSAGEEVIVTTESGNEISMSEIKIIQNPTTNEIALYIPENGDDEIPEGFKVIGDVISAAQTGENESDASDEEGEDEEEDLDSSRKTRMNSSRRRSPAKKKN